MYSKKLNSHQLYQNFFLFLILSFYNVLYINKSMYIFFAPYLILYSYFILILFYLLLSFRQFSRKMIYYFIIFLCYECFSVILNQGGIGSIFTSLYGILFIYILSIYRIDKSMLFLLFCVSFLILFELLPYALKFNRTFSSSINNDLFNSNTVGNLMVESSLLCYIILKEIQKFNALGLILLFIGLLGGYFCEARGSFLIFFSFMIFNISFIKNVIFNSKKCLLFFIGFIFFFGLIFPLFYVKMFFYWHNYTIPFFNKSLYTGRQDIWIKFFDLFDYNLKRILFGVGSKVTELGVGNGVQHLHNNGLAVITSFGLIGLFLYYGFYLFYINRIYVFSSGFFSDTQKRLILYFASICMNGIIENPLISFSFFPFISLGLLCSFSHDVLEIDDYFYCK